MYLEVPPLSPINSPFEIIVGDAEPGTTVRIAVATTDHAGQTFTGEHDFTVGADGTVSTTHTLPLSAEWTPPSAAGILWTMTGDGNEFTLRDTTPITFTVTVRTSGQPGLQAKAQRHFPRGIHALDNAPASLGGGTVYLPDGDAKHPAVLLIGDATGTACNAAAAELAGEGFVAIAANWVPADNTPRNLSNISKHLRGLTRLPGIDTTLPLGIIGVGRGAELALMIASTLNHTGPVVAHSPSDVRTQQPSRKGSHPTWIADDDQPETQPHFDTTALTAPGIKDAGSDWRAFIQPALKGKPWQLGEYYHSARAHDDVTAARIKVENISCPLLLTAGDEDPVWHSHSSQDRIVEKLRGLNDNVFAVDYHNAGYGVGYPMTFTGIPHTKTASLYGHRVLVGGTPAGRGKAAISSRTNTLSFLRSAFDALREPTPTPTNPHSTD
ncbi:acyl-CoA thioester hydrolase/BAAT C-terminal domain-containing protein [Corynebacterium aquilae]|nr:acyl-CoA thioester hydrolase/BAAT C-terminal domain-containing protein [Corynebacterium aquilae]